MIEIDNLNDPRIVEFITLRANSLGKHIICDGHKVVSKLFSSNLELSKIFVTKDYYNQNKSIIGKYLDSNSIFVSEKSLMEKIIGHSLHHGVMAMAQSPKESNISELDDKIIILNGVTSPENVGAIVRSATAFGINSIISDSKSSSPLLRRAIRVSMGNIFYAKIFRSQNLSIDINHLKKLGYVICGTANENISIPLPNYKFPRKCALIIGSEGWGMDENVRRACDTTLKIPMDSNVAHLNAAMAASICLYQMSDFNK